MSRRYTQRDVDHAVQNAVDFGPCPECHTPISVHLSDDGSPCAVLHVLPQCPRFVQMEAGAYLSWVIEVREVTRSAIGEA